MCVRKLLDVFILRILFKEISLGLSIKISIQIKWAWISGKQFNLNVMCPIKDVTYICLYKRIMYPKNVNPLKGK